MSLPMIIHGNYLTLTTSTKQVKSSTDLSYDQWYLQNFKFWGRAHKKDYIQLYTTFFAIHPMLYNSKNVLARLNIIQYICISGRGATKGYVCMQVVLVIFLLWIKNVDLDNRYKESCNLGMLVCGNLNLVSVLWINSFGKSKILFSHGKLEPIDANMVLKVLIVDEFVKKWVYV